MRAWLVLALIGVASAARADVVVQTRAGLLTVRASAAPLSDVLDRVARLTGMKVAYEGAPPKTPLTTTIEGRTPVEAVLGLLEGTGLNYALALDASGKRIDTLLLLGGPGNGPLRLSGPSGPAPPVSAMRLPAARIETPPPTPLVEPETPSDDASTDQADGAEEEETADATAGQPETSVAQPVPTLAGAPSPLATGPGGTLEQPTNGSITDPRGAGLAIAPAAPASLSPVTGFDPFSQAPRGPRQQPNSPEPPKPEVNQ